MGLDFVSVGGCLWTLFNLYLSASFPHYYLYCLYILRASLHVLILSASLNFMTDNSFLWSSLDADNSI